MLYHFSPYPLSLFEADPFLFKSSLGNRARRQSQIYRTESSANRIQRFSLNRSLDPVKKELRRKADGISRLTTVFSHMCSKLMPLSEPHNKYSESTQTSYTRPQSPIEEFEITQIASKALYQSLCQACPIHTEHIVHLNLKTDQIFTEETAHVRFYLALKSDAHPGDPMWIEVDSVLNTQTMEAAQEEPHTIRQEHTSYPTSDPKRHRKIIKPNRVSKRYSSLLGKSSAKSTAVLSISEVRSHVSTKVLESGSLGFSKLHSSGKQLGQCLGLLPQQESDHIGVLKVSTSHHHLVSLTPAAKIPKSKEPKSLANLIDKSQQNTNGSDPRLRKFERLRLARLIATAVLQFNSTPWLEKYWSSEDLVFFELDGTDKLSPPHLNARVVKGRSQNDLTMPATTGSIPGERNPLLFCLGVVLLELAYEKPFRVLHEEERDKVEGKEGHHYSALDTARRLSKNVDMTLGAIYAKVVRQCIDCDFGHGEDDLNDSGLRTTFYHNVICVLSKLEESMRGWVFGD